MSLSQQQQKFSYYCTMLFKWIYEQPGYSFTFGEAYRTPEQAVIYAKAGKGIIDSLHCQRLAIDINLFIDGVYQTTTEAYKPLGTYWKSLDPNCKWGGDFITRKDGNHFQYHPINLIKEV